MDSVEEQIVKKLDILVKLTALNSVKDRSFQEQVKILSEIGLQPKEIANILNKTGNLVRVTLHRIESKRKRK